MSGGVQVSQQLTDVREEPVLGIRLTWAGPTVREGNDVHLVLRSGSRVGGVAGQSVAGREQEGNAVALRLGKCLLEPRVLQEANARLRATPSSKSLKLFTCCCLPSSLGLEVASKPVAAAQALNVLVELRAEKETKPSEFL